MAALAHVLGLKRPLTNRPHDNTTTHKETADDHVHHPASPRPEKVSRGAAAKRRGDSGLTTLEWLLIVAAVAGLAALAVVLVRNVVTETSEQISGSSARLTAATLEAADITEKALEHAIRTDSDANSTADIAAMNDKWGGRCERMRLSYNAAFESNNPKKTSKWTDGVKASGAHNGSWGDANETAPLCSIVDA